MRLHNQAVAQWPKLAWTAQITAGSEEVEVLHGRMVETTDRWIVEAAWDKDFTSGDFDETDLVFGTGIRIRKGRAVFVSSGTVFDRLVYCRLDGSLHVSNSLPALLAVTGLDLRDDYPAYSGDVRSIMRGLTARVRTIPTTGPEVTSVFYNNLVWSDGQLREVEKADTAPEFRSYVQYREYLRERAEGIGRNARDPRRRYSVELLSSISSGYDSTATSVIARDAGCDRTVTIRESSSFWRGSDSGKPIADILGMSCEEYPRRAQDYPLEEAFWAAEGRAGILNWSQFDFPEPLCLFFTGCHGEKMWDRVDHDHPDPFVRRDPSSLGFCEFRLQKGVFQCVVPFWGVRHSKELRAITLSDEMQPWYMNRDHDKPIARRIVETEGVARGMFGVLNKNTSLEEPFLWPYSQRARERFGEYLRKGGVRPYEHWTVVLFRRMAHYSNLLYQNSFKKLGLHRWWRPWRRSKARGLLFQWANHELKRKYAEELAGRRAIEALGPGCPDESNV